jgi:hypothetical protein
VNDQYLEALDDAADGRKPPVEAAAARSRMRAALAAEQRDVLDDPARFVALRTARAAGKTSTMVADALDQMSSVAGWRGCYGSLTRDSGQEQLWDELRRQDAAFGFGLRYIENDSTAIYEPTGARLRIRSVETHKEIDKWRGKQYHRIYIDECQSVEDGALSYAIVSVLPHTLARHRGSIRLGGTPRMRCEGWWYHVTGPPGVEAQRFPDGSVRALARPWAQRAQALWQEIGWSWSLHNWPRAANPGLTDADRESDDMRRALAATEADRDAIAVELDGEWPAKDEAARLVRFDPVLNTWLSGPADANYGLAEGHEWGFFLGADLALKRDWFALELGACSPTSPIAYHCDEFTAKKLTIAEMALQINKFRHQLGTRLKAIVGDTQGPTGSWIFEELTRVHGLPIEKAKKGQKDDGVELLSSDLMGGRMQIKVGTELARQMRDLRKPMPNLPVSKQPKQKDDAFDAWLYARRRMTHMFGREPSAVPPEVRKRQAEQRQLRAMQNQMSEAGTFRGARGIAQATRGRPW